MQVLAVKVGLTKNTGNYENVKLEIEASPSDGQTADQLLAEVGEYMQSQVEIAVANMGGIKEKPAKKEKPATTAPLKGAKSGESSDSNYANGVADAGATKPAETIINQEPTKAKGKGSPKSQTQAKAAANANKVDHKKELTYALDSETLDELLERFNSVRKLASEFGDGWEAAVSKIADRYRKLNSLDANPETLNAIVKGFKAEREAIEKMRSEQPQAAAA